MVPGHVGHGQHARAGWLRDTPHTPEQVVRHGRRDHVLRGRAVSAVCATAAGTTVAAAHATCLAFGVAFCASTSRAVTTGAIAGAASLATATGTAGAFAIWPPALRSAVDAAIAICAVSGVAVAAVGASSGSPRRAADGADRLVLAVAAERLSVWQQL